MDNNYTPSTPDPMASYKEPIARAGESQYGCIMRNRSGMDAGLIDFGARDITPLGGEMKEVVNTAYAMYETFVNQAGVRASRDVDTAKIGRAIGLFASAIKSGENWTESCQAAYDDAVKELLKRA